MKKDVFKKVVNYVACFGAVIFLVASVIASLVSLGIISISGSVFFTYASSLILVPIVAIFSIFGEVSSFAVIVGVLIVTLFALALVPVCIYNLTGKFEHFNFVNFIVLAVLGVFAIFRVISEGLIVSTLGIMITIYFVIAIAVAVYYILEKYLPKTEVTTK